MNEFDYTSVCIVYVYIELLGGSYMNEGNYQT